MLVFVKPGVPEKGSVCSRGRDEKAGVAIKKTQTENVGAHKPPEGTNDDRKRRPLGLFLNLSLQIKVGIIRKFLQEISNRRAAIVA